MARHCVTRNQASDRSGNHRDMLIVHWIGRLLRFLGRLLLRPGVLFAVRMLGGWSFVLAVIALNFLGDGLRDASDPYNK